MPAEAAPSSAVPAEVQSPPPAEVDALEAFRQKHWGRRDGWTSLIAVCTALGGAVGLISVWTGAAHDHEGTFAIGAALLAQTAVQGCYVFRLRWARAAVLAVPAITLAVAVATGGWGVASLSLYWVLLLLAASFSTRNRLFFRIEVSREELQRAWDHTVKNTVALAGFLFGIASVLFGGFAPLGIGLSIVGVARVDPAAHPPIGRRGLAIAGILLSVAGLVLWAFIAVALAEAFALAGA